MKTCKDCIHQQVCVLYDAFDYEEPMTGDLCRFFKDKSRFIELPCSIGDYCTWDNNLWYVNNITYCCDGDFLLWMSMADKSPCGAEASSSEVKFISQEEVKRMLEELK